MISFARLSSSNLDFILKLNLFGLSLLLFFLLRKFFSPIIFATCLVFHRTVLLLLPVFSFAFFHLDALSIAQKKLKLNKLVQHTHY